MANAIDVAAYLLHIARLEEEPEYLTHLRLQKLLYYVQGWSVGLRNDVMFHARIEAWTNGPVVKPLYSTFSSYRSSPIMESPADAGELSSDEKFFVKLVWDGYKCYSPNYLRQKTHKEPPWINARIGLRPSDRSNAEITLASMREFFTPESDENPLASFVGMPSWKGRSNNAKFVDSAQTVFAKHADALRRLAQ